jgi:hypothetical protein
LPESPELPKSPKLKGRNYLPVMMKADKRGLVSRFSTWQSLAILAFMAIDETPSKHSQ